MKNILFILSLSGFSTLQAQEDESDYFEYRKELTLITGYNNSLGFIGAKLGFVPNLLKNRFQINGGLGFNLIQSALFSTGVNGFISTKKMIQPYIGINYIYGFENTLISDDNSQEEYRIGSHQHLSTYGAIRIRTGSHMFNIKLKIGYKFLISEMDVSPINNSTNINQGKIENRLDRVC